MQEARFTGRLAYRKVLGTTNPADVLTKHVPAELLQRYLEKLCTEVRGGRAEAATELNSIESVIVEWKIKKEVRFAKKADRFRQRTVAGSAEDTTGKRSWASGRGPTQAQGERAPSVPVAIPTPRRRWADLCEEEEEEENKNAKITARNVGHSQGGSNDAENARGKSENTIDYVEAEAANDLRASEGCREREK